MQLVFPEADGGEERRIYLGVDETRVSNHDVIDIHKYLNTESTRCGPGKSIKQPGLGWKGYSWLGAGNFGFNLYEALELEA